MRVLLIRPDHLGDVVLTLPAVAALRRARPSWSVGFAVAEGLEAIPERAPFVDEVIGLPFPSPKVSGSPAEWDAFAGRHAARLSGRWDAAVLLRPRDPWSGALASAAGIATRVGFDEPLTVPFLGRAVTEPRGAHATRIAAAPLSDLVGTPLEPETDGVLAPTAADHQEVDGLLNDLPVGDEPAVLHPGVGWELKRWPAGRWAAVARDVAARVGAPVLVTGVPNEGAFVDEIVGRAEGLAVGVAGRLSLGGFAALLARTRIVVACDSGPVHLAAALRTPVVALFGPGDPAEAAPWPDPSAHRVVRVDLWCSPCGTMENPPCGATIDPACMRSIDPAMVVRAVDEVLTQAVVSPAKPPGRGVA